MDHKRRVNVRTATVEVQPARGISSRIPADRISSDMDSQLFDAAPRYSFPETIG